MSPSAFSRRIQALEAFVGVPLFVRGKGSVALSRTGERYLRMVEPALDAIRRASVDLQAERGGIALRVVVSQSFAIGWLIPRLARFRSEHPQINIELRIGHGVDALPKGHADMAIYAGKGVLEPMPTVGLLPIRGILASAPILSSGQPSPRDLGDISKYDRLAVYRPEGLWESWLTAVGYAGPQPPPPTYFDAQFVMFEAAAAGLGLALLTPVLAHRLISDGRLVRIGDYIAPLGLEYQLVFADDAVRRRSDATLFTAWLREDLREFAAANDC